ncbi:MAG: glutamate-1-semialdehyde 2,1-aminomutase [Actinomycetota bacterium]|nr:glutamate-1-semialdehyde 2,1-aminomutase [Actinomycetota bacterium]MDI6821277.1 glutamate-1-semialdehyde 2,1-aminomutase [Actinomycetota bacterium]
MDMSKSHELFSRAKEYIPGGVNSPVRAFKAVGMEPLFITKGKGSKIYDVDGNEYIDYVCSWGPLILGHAHPKVISAVKDILENGTSFGACTELEVELAKQIIEAVPSIERVRMVNSGTEATMSAIRLARGYTGREKVIKFEGCYHGHVDHLLVKAGSGVATLAIPGTPGVTSKVALDTIVLSYNDLESVGRIVREQHEEIACIIVEPIAGNMGVVLPQPGFLEGLRKITREYGIILIFDEVITGFRVSYGGAQELYSVIPDLTCLGKIIGGGFPVGAFGGRREIMECVAPVGSVYQAGTLSGNPIAMTAGLMTLKILSDGQIYQDLERKGAMLSEGLRENARELGIKAHFTRVGSLLCMFFTDKEVLNFETAASSDTEKYARYFREMLKSGIYLAPSQFEACFISTAHTDEDIQRTIEANREALKKLR